MASTLFLAGAASGRQKCARARGCAPGRVSGLDYGLERKKGRGRGRERERVMSHRGPLLTRGMSYLLGLRPRLRGRDGLGDYPRRVVVPPQPTKKKKREEERDLEQRVFVAGFGMVLLERTLVAFLFCQSSSFAWC